MEESRRFILDEIRRIAADAAGSPPGVARFSRVTGLPPSTWTKYWARWGDALVEAGFQPNRLQAAYSDDHLTALLAEETRRLARFPTARDLRVRHHSEPGFPDAKVFERWSKLEQRRRVAAYCTNKPEWSDVLAQATLAQDGSDQGRTITAASSSRSSELGQVYLIRVGRHYKIGHTRAFARRMRQLDTALAEGRQVIHIIRSDDPEGIESYWHRRFAAQRRGDTEWFDLTAADVAAFRRRSFM